MRENAHNLFDGNAFQENFRNRLATLFESISQSEMARKTGFPQSSINHYAKDRKAPAEFCAALVSTAGVNPAWLLTGEGSRMLADVSTDTSAMAGDLLDLVKAMEAVTRRKLGSLAGSNQLLALRELNDALESFELLQAKVNKHSESVFRNIVDDMQNVFWEQQPERLESLVRAGLQVSRLCHDPELQRDFKFRLANYHMRKREYDKAREIYREVLFSLIASGELITQAGCARIYQFVMSERSAYRPRSASRICDALLTMLRDHGRDWPEYHLVVVLGAYLEIELGRLDRALPVLVNAHARTPKNTRDANSAILFAQAMVLSGSMALADVKGMRLFEPASVPFLVSLTFWTLDAEELSNVLNWQREHAQDVRSGAVTFLFVQCALEALGKPMPASWLDRVAADIAAAWKNEAHADLGQHYITPAIMGQLAWQSGNMKEASQYAIETERRIVAGEPEETLPLLYRAMHYRTALKACSESKDKESRTLVAHARSFFDTHVAAGYRLFEGA